MAWYSSNYSYRALVSVDNSAGGAGAVDIVITVPAGFERFWDTVLSTGYDVIFTDAAGNLLTYERETWNTTTRSARFNIDGLSPAADAIEVVHMYWGYAAASDGSASFAETDNLTSVVELGAPVPSRSVVVRPDAPGVSMPLARFSKLSDETLRIWWDITDMLMHASTPVYDRLFWEEAKSLEFGSDDTDAYAAGVPATLITEADCRVEEIDDHTWVCTPFGGGTDGTDYTLRLKVIGIRAASAGAYTQSTIEGRALLQVRDTDETG